MSGNFCADGMRQRKLDVSGQKVVAANVTFFFSVAQLLRTHSTAYGGPPTT